MRVLSWSLLHLPHSEVAPDYAALCIAPCKGLRDHSGLLTFYGSLGMPTRSYLGDLQSKQLAGPYPYRELDPCRAVPSRRLCTVDTSENKMSSNINDKIKSVSTFSLSKFYIFCDLSFLFWKKESQWTKSKSNVIYVQKRYRLLRPYAITVGHNIRSRPADTVPIATR
jgi:hypothetical protein